MKRQTILIDTGPIVAILSKDDQHHERCVEQLGELVPPLFTCWPVVTEAHWLLRQKTTALDDLYRSFETGLLALLPLDESALPWMHGFIRRYAKLRPDLADAALVFLANRESINTLFTVDQRDFSIYRSDKNHPFNLIPPPFRK